MEASLGTDLAGVGAQMDSHEGGRLRTDWVCEKWEQDQVDFAMKKVEVGGVARLTETGLMIPHFLGGKLVWRPAEEGLPSEILRGIIEPDEVVEIAGNLLLNEGIQRLLDLAIAAGGTAFNNANSYIGVGDSVTAEAATQTDLSAASNKFYKGMVATYPQRTAQTLDFRSDFTGTEANYAWQEWSISAGATSASGAGFTVGTTNLNRKVQSLGTKASGTWTMTGSVTIS